MMDPRTTALAEWQRVKGRHGLPWQGQGPYATWISEIMLQQTQVAVAIPYFEAFMARFPTPQHLAAASQDEVLAAWAGLGYYARARNLHAASRQIRDDYDGHIPSTLQALMSLKGIGRSTAGAILALGFNTRGVIQDGNVRRVLCRLFAIAGDPTKAPQQKRLWELADTLTPHDGLGAAIHAQAMMDLGALICTRARPSCDACPLSDSCQAHQTNRVADYPTPRTIPQKPDALWIVLQLTDPSGRTYLEKRPDHGIWGGLWAPPIDDSLTALGRRLGIEHVIDDATECSQISHVFSHFRVRLQHHTLTVNDVSPSNNSQWADLQTFEGGLPAPIHTLLFNRGQAS